MSPAPRLLGRISLVIALLWSTPLHGASLFDPALRFRTMATDHFVIYFHRGEEQLASRLAAIAEDAWDRLRLPLGAPVQKRTHVVLVDQSELANGSAFPIPYNTIMVTAAWPAASEFIGNTDDWLRLVFTHEFAHIVHLDRSGGWAKAVRRVFGRTPLAFPNVFLPIWHIEGLATFEESQLTGEGRLHAGDFRAIEREAARARVLPPIDRVNGGLTSWPDGYAPYAYGLGFHAYLAERYGQQSIAALAERTARRVPYFVGGAYRRVYDRRLSALWNDYQASLIASVEAITRTTDATQLTHHGFSAIGPRFAAPPRFCPSCPAEIVYSLRTPHGFPALNAIAIDGSAPRRLTTRFLGSTTGIGDDIIVFDQQELRRNVGLYSDLFAFDRRRGRVRRLTSGARLLDPDLSPDQTAIVCVREGLGRRELVTVRLKADTTAANAGVVSGFSRTVDEITTLISEPDTQFNAPRWAPDGRQIAVERHALGRDSEIVIVDPVSQSVRVVASQLSTRFVTPTWRRDGRAIIAAAAPDEGTFDLYEFELAASAADDRTIRQRRLTFTTGGATWPDVSHDGSTLAYVGYTAGGFELFTMPYPTTSGSDVRPDVGPVLRPGLPGASHAQGEPGADSARPEARADNRPLSRRYNPLPTLKPTAWSPVIEAADDEVRLGVATAGHDVLGYHGFAAAATWLVSGSDNSTGASASPDWEVAYAYDRWRPTLFGSASHERSQSHQVEGGIFWPMRTVRVSNRGVASIWRAVDDMVDVDGSTLNRTGTRFGWATSTAREYGFSVSPERGLTAGATAEVVRTEMGATGNSATMTADVRSYLPAGRAHHVVALRAAAGVSTGDLAVRRIFSLGGAAPNGSVLDFGGDAFSLLRGFDPDAFVATRVAVVNADYRWPIARAERGLGTLPLFVHTIHAAVFADAGHAWNTVFRASDIKTSAGGELSADIVFGYSVRLAVSAGAAWRRDGARPFDHAGSGPAIYARVGRAF